MDVISSSPSVQSEVNTTESVAETISTSNSEETSVNINSVSENEESKDISLQEGETKDTINSVHSIIKDNNKIGSVDKNISDSDNADISVDEPVSSNTNIHCSSNSDSVLKNDCESEPKLEAQFDNLDSTNANEKSPPLSPIKEKEAETTTETKLEDKPDINVEPKPDLTGEQVSSPKLEELKDELPKEEQNIPEETTEVMSVDSSKAEDEEITVLNDNKEDALPEIETETENEQSVVEESSPKIQSTELDTKVSSEMDTTPPEIETSPPEIETSPPEIETSPPEIETSPEIETLPETETAPPDSETTPSESETAPPDIELVSEMESSPIETESILEQKALEENSPADSKSSKEQIEDCIKDEEKNIIVTDVDVHAEDIPDTDEMNQINDTLSEVDDQTDQDLQQEKPVFVHVSSKADGESDLTEVDKTLNSDSHSETGDEHITCLVEEDPIGINQETDKDDLIDYSEEGDKETIKVVDFGDETMTSDKSAIDDELVASKGADEELCIIPDTEREISQEEKDAATAAAAAAAELPRPTEDSIVVEDSSENASQQTDRETVENSSDKNENSTEENAQASIDEEFMASVNNSSQEVTDKPEIKVTEIPEEEAAEQTCHQCTLVRKCLYKVDNQDNATYICSDTCLISFRTLNKPPLATLKGKAELKLKNIYRKMPDSDVSKIFVRKCAECSEKIKQGHEKVLSWETMDFCNEDCLSKYQNRIGSHCANCKKTVLMSSLGKYCVRFGHDIRQFCCSLCLEEFKKGLKVCSYCQKDISGGSEGFLAPVGDKGQFKDFCSQLCMEKYDQMNNKNTNSKYQLPIDISQCAVCNNVKQIQVNFDQQNKNKKHKFCSYPCFVAFRFVNQIDPFQCDMCKNFFDNDNCTEYSIYYDKLVKNFCCKTCQNIYIIANRKIVPCSWCKVKKYNFDMIKRSCNNGQILMMCSLNCLSLFQVSVNAVSSKRLKCDFCAQITQAQYHLTMSDATIRNFCTYHCVMSFQSQYAKMPITLEHGDKSGNKPVPAGGPKKYSNRGSRTVCSGNDTNTINEVRMPVITSVESLANNNGSSRTNSVKINSHQSSPQPEPPKVQIKQQIIVKAPPLPPMKNAMTMCKPLVYTKSVSCKPHLATKETQTDEIKEKTVIVPVPVPMYVPAPLHMYSAPVPVPIPFPLPVPVPVFIPTTRNSAAGIMKEIKKIQVKIPTDPFEAELLMMAEMVAGEKKVDNTDSESEEDDNGDGGADGGFSPEAVDTSNTFGDDMLQMALKMATELDEPAVDLEGALTANTITASQNQDSAGVVATEEAVDDPQPMHQLMDRQAIRGRKRANRQPRNMNNPAKRGRRLSSHVEMPLLPPPQPTQPPEPIEKPDANMCLKYTFGVNAWKQWVTTKNAELEKSSRRVKLFKNEILQLTADELNYSLCLFVKEVRKPNGTEYAPDTIYYLCLGIQQYLFENGRIDNIFTDAYYEKFTDCLDEVARKFSVLYNDSHYIVTRVEEEHLWESKQLGAHSPHVLLSTLMFFNTKHFNLTTVDEHMQLSFSHIMKHWKRNPNQPGAAKIPGSRNVLLRFYPPQTSLDSNSRKKKVYEQQENEENPLRCPVKLYEFYLSKCPESVKTRNDVFYLLPERSCVPDSPVWYSTMALGREALEKMLHRVKMVKEINVALLTS